MNEPASALVANQEVGETHEVGGRECRLIDDPYGWVGESRIRESDCFGQRRSIARPHLLDGGHAIWIVRQILLQHALLVAVTQPRRTLQRQVFGLDDLGDTTQASIDRPHPGELAFRRGFEVARARDQPAFVLDITHGTLSVCDPTRGLGQSSIRRHRPAIDLRRRGYFVFLARAVRSTSEIMKASARPTPTVTIPIA